MDADTITVEFLMKILKNSHPDTKVWVQFDINDHDTKFRIYAVDHSIEDDFAVIIKAG